MHIYLHKRVVSRSRSHWHPSRRLWMRLWGALVPSTLKDSETTDISIGGLAAASLLPQSTASMARLVTKGDQPPEVTERPHPRPAFSDS